MNYRIELHPLALLEMEDSYHWHEDWSLGLGSRFLAAIQNRFDRITAMPELYAKKKVIIAKCRCRDFRLRLSMKRLKNKKLFLFLIFSM